MSFKNNTELILSLSRLDENRDYQINLISQKVQQKFYSEQGFASYFKIELDLDRYFHVFTSRSSLISV